MPKRHFIFTDSREQSHPECTKAGRSLCLSQYMPQDAHIYYTDHKTNWHHFNMHLPLTPMKSFLCHSLIHKRYDWTEKWNVFNYLLTPSFNSLSRAEMAMWWVEQQLNNERWACGRIAFGLLMNRVRKMKPQLPFDSCSIFFVLPLALTHSFTFDSRNWIMLQ